MSRIRTIRYVLVSALVTVLLVAQGAAALAQPAPPTLRNATCEQVRASIPSAGDGNYLLFTERAIVSVYCHDMAGTPREYLTLANTGADSNFSQYTAGVASPGTDVRTTFTRLRVDPATLTVDIGDLTFAESTGSLTHDQETVSSMPYGVAMSCTGGPDGTANVNLSGTPFTVTDTFSTDGFGADGSEDRSANGQLINLNGGGSADGSPPIHSSTTPSTHSRVTSGSNSTAPRTSSRGAGSASAGSRSPGATARVWCSGRPPVTG